MADRYRPLFKLDAGGMAEVYVAEAESVAGFKKKVAIKRILPSLLKEERFVRMFLDEARLALHLNHANIVSVFDIGKSSSTYFIVMEYVDGTNLKYILQYLSRRRQPMPIHLAVWILNEILKGLDYAHHLRDPEEGRTFGIVHRDISPPNILISWNGEVKLTDFGLAKASTQLESTDPGVVKGKFAYLSPEAANGREVDARADLFAVGIIAFEMLTGRRLFLGESDYDTVERVRRADVPSMREINPEIPGELERIIMKALARDPEHRFDHASDFAEELLGFLFSRSLKVSSRDLSELLSDLRRTEPVASAADAAEKKAAEAGEDSNLIFNLIQEEFVSFKSLDDEDEQFPTGSQPLDTLTAGFAGTYDPSAPLPIGDFDSSEDSPAGGRDPTPPPSPHSSPMRLGRSPSGPYPASTPPKKSGGGALKWLVMLLVLVAGGGGAYYYLIVLGNLPK
jgi:serine/threonine-protein kinase